MNPAVRAIVEGETKFSKNLDRLKSLRSSEDAAPPSKEQDLKQLFLAMREEVPPYVKRICSADLQITKHKNV